MNSCTERVHVSDLRSICSVGVHRFLARVWRTMGDGVTEDEPTKEQLKAINACIKKVTVETEELRFNTANAAKKEISNAANKWETKPRAALGKLRWAACPIHSSAHCMLTCVSFLQNRLQFCWLHMLHTLQRRCGREWDIQNLSHTSHGQK